MPRIAAALGVVATVAICIGLNTYRYPMVRAMVAATPQLETATRRPSEPHPSPANASTLGDATRQQVAEHQPPPATPIVVQAAETPAPTSRAIDVDRRGRDTDAGAPLGAPAVGGPVVASPPGREEISYQVAPLAVPPAAAAEAKPIDDHSVGAQGPDGRETPPREPAQGGLAPLHPEPPIVIPGNGSPSPPNADTGDRDLGNGVVCLPPIDQVETVRAGTRDVPFRGGEIPAYPSTVAE